MFGPAIDGLFNGPLGSHQPKTDWQKKCADNQARLYQGAGYIDAHSAFNQPAMFVDRRHAEHILQQISGQLLGVEQMSDSDLQSRLPPQYRLTTSP